MRMPGLSAEASLLSGSGNLYRGRAAGGAGGVSMVRPAQAWGYSTSPSYPGQSCVLVRRCIWFCSGPSPADCDRFCENWCLYPVIPKHTVFGAPPDLPQ
jgi:hypothetical protein